MRKNQQIEIFGLQIGSGLDDQGSFPCRGRGIFSLPPRPDQIWSPHNLLYDGHWRHLPWVKEAGCETDHSPPSSAVVKNEWSYPSTLPILFITW